MGVYWKALAGAVLAVVMMLMLRRQELAALLGMAVCAMIVMVAVDYLRPVWELLDSLQTMGQLDGQMIMILLKAVGIGLVTEIACMVCADSGSASLAKTLQFLGTAAVLWISIPLFTALLDLIQGILEAL